MLTMSSGKQQEGRPPSSRVMSSKDQPGGAVANNGSFRVYYSLGAAGAVPFVWETKPGTPKSTVVPAARADDGYDAPPMTMMISPPPSYHSKARKGYTTKRRATAKSSSSYWPSRWLLPGWMDRWLGVRSRLWPSSSSADGDRWLAPVDSGKDNVQGRRPRRRAVLMCF